MSVTTGDVTSIQLDYSRCRGCGDCIITCHTRAIRINLGTLSIDYSLCDICTECVEVCPVDAFSTIMDSIEVHPIEAESYSIIQPMLEELNVSRELIPLAARVLHATTDKELAGSLWCSQNAVNQVITALHAGYPIITDVEMTRSGLTGALKQRAICALSLPDHPHTKRGDTTDAPSTPAEDLIAEPQDNSTTNTPSLPNIPTVSAASMFEAASQYRDNALFIIGCAPTALEQLMDITESGHLRPAGVLALPVGFVGAEQAKNRLMNLSVQYSFPAITNVGPKGGSAATAACMNAIYRVTIEKKRMPYE